MLQEGAQNMIKVIKSDMIDGKTPLLTAVLQVHHYLKQSVGGGNLWGGSLFCFSYFQRFDYAAFYFTI